MYGFRRGLGQLDPLNPFRGQNSFRRILAVHVRDLDGTLSESQFPLKESLIVGLILIVQFLQDNIAGQGMKSTFQYILQ